MALELAHQHPDRKSSVTFWADCRRSGSNFLTCVISYLLLSPASLLLSSLLCLSLSGWSGGQAGVQAGTEAREAFHLSPTPPPPQAPEAQRATSKSSSTPPINVLRNRFSESYISLRMSSQRIGLQLFNAGTSSLTSRLSTTTRSESRWVSVCVCVGNKDACLFLRALLTAHTMQLGIRVGRRGEDKP